MTQVLKLMTIIRYDLQRQDHSYALMHSSLNYDDMN